MSKAALSDLYRAYIACLNARDWERLGDFVADDVTHNERPFGLSGYRNMLENDYETIPDLVFHIRMLVSDPPVIAARLGFHCTPKGTFVGLPVNGRRIAFCENVIYAFRGNRIAAVWSVIDKVAIEAQLERL